jgi:hypothetical protein
MWYDQTFPGTLPLHPSGAILEDAVSKIAVSGTTTLNHDFVVGLFSRADHSLGRDDLHDYFR